MDNKEAMAHEAEFNVSTFGRDGPPTTSKAVWESAVRSASELLCNGTKRVFLFSFFKSLSFVIWHIPP